MLFPDTWVVAGKHRYYMIYGYHTHIISILDIYIYIYILINICVNIYIYIIPITFDIQYSPDAPCMAYLPTKLGQQCGKCR